MISTEKTYLNWLSRLRQREDLLRIFIFTAFTVFCWVGISLYLSQQKTKIPSAVQKLALPLSPIIDRETIQEIESRRFFSDDELQQFPIYIYRNTEDGQRVLVQIGQELSTVSENDADILPTVESEESTIASDSSTVIEEEIIEQETESNEEIIEEQ